MGARSAGLAALITVVSAHPVTIVSERTTYVLTCLYGLEEELCDEVAERCGIEPSHGWSEVSVSSEGDPARLRELRLAVNAFEEFVSFRMGPTHDDLRALEARLLRLPLTQWEEHAAAVAGREVESPDVSISVDRSGEHNYTYKDVENLACEVVSEATGRRTVLESRPLELRILIREETCRLRGRLTPVPLSHRAYKVRGARCETDPTLAAAMVRISEPTARGRFLDPFAGTATVALERALLGPAERVVAADVNARRLDWARANVQAAGADINLVRCDAHRLPFADRTFSRIVSAPPQGDPTDGTRWDPEALAALLADPFRVLEYGGVSVWLIRDSRVFERAVSLVGLNRLVEKLVVDWKGKPCHIYSLERVP